MNSAGGYFVYILLQTTNSAVNFSLHYRAVCIWCRVGVPSVSTGSLGGHGLADRQYCFHLRSSVTGHARFYKIIVVFSMLWYTDSKRTGNLKERKNYHADTRITTAANLITAAAASLEHPVPGRCCPGRDAEKRGDRQSPVRPGQNPRHGRAAHQRADAG